MNTFNQLSKFKLILLLFLTFVHCLENADFETSKSKNGKKASMIEKKSDLKASKFDSSSAKYNENDDGHHGDLLPNHSSSNETLLNVDFNSSNFTDELLDENRAINEYNEEMERRKSGNQAENIKMNFSYFEMEFIQDPKEAMALWIDLKDFSDSHFKHEVLSNSHRRAAAISLPFNFTFYGHNLTKITVATGGFLYMGDHVHAWLAATQYIAPLMANFDTRNSSDSQILYGFNSSVFVVQWENVQLQGDELTGDKEFTFQCSIHSNGDIVFVYKKIPIPIDDINEEEHPVKVGISDAYFFNRQQIFVRRKTIYEYHKIDLRKNEAKLNIRNNTAIFLKALPTCSQFKDCHSCLSGKTSFQCSWCDEVKRCSDGYDRLRQDWVAHHCDKISINETDKCLAPASSIPPQIIPSTITNQSSATNNNAMAPTTFRNNSSINDHQQTNNNGPSDNIDLHSDKRNNLTNLEYNTQEQRVGSRSNKARSSSSSTSSTAHSSLIISLFFIISLLLGVSLWVLYAYRNPTSSSGLFMIRWRPSTWRWNSSDTRYTAASIHM